MADDKLLIYVTAAGERIERVLLREEAAVMHAAQPGPSTASNGVWYVCAHCSMWVYASHACPQLAAMDLGVPPTPAARRKADEDEVVALLTRLGPGKVGLLYRYLKIGLGLTVERANEAIRKEYGS